MKTVCIGGGPAGLYFAISAKLRDAGHDITVVERDPADATYGWGVVYWDDLLDILGERATDLGADVQYRREVTDTSTLTDADLVVCDGANSRLRQRHRDHFGTRADSGGNPYIWLGTDKVFDSFTFAFEQTSAGWIWFHAYPSSSGISTCIVECTQPTWLALGFDSLSSKDSAGLLEKIFEHALDGHALISQSRGQPAHWQRCTHLTNKTWCHDNLVLVGDAAHTTHFTLGSGTRLAMIDAVMLVQSIYDRDDPATAAQDYDRRGRAALRPIHAGARSGMAWFERADRYLDRDAVTFAYATSARHGAQPPWRYQTHLATQIPAVRTAMRGVDTARRWYLARRRREPSAALGSV
jgi:2-polyprenyl-6-methoxyphenol hydroxylase-like FAD-dependent oxidoreductase